MLHFEDFPVGKQFHFTPVEMKAADIVAFATEFDPQPMHLSQEAGEASILGGLAASGWHTSAVMMRMLFEAYLKDTASEGSPGIDRMEWKRPVLAGDILSGTATVLEARASGSRPSIGIVTLRGDVINQRGEAVALCDYANMIRRNPEGSSADENV